MNKSHLKPLKLLESGLKHHQNGEFNEAIAIYQKILAVNPLHFDALKLLGTVYAQTNKFELALSFIDYALKIKPNNIGLLNNRGNILKELQRTDGALAPQLRYPSHHHLSLWSERIHPSPLNREVYLRRLRYF